MFGINKVRNAYSPLQEVIDQQRDALISTVNEAQHIAAFTQKIAAAVETKAPRPGDTPPRPFVGRTLDTLNKTLESYSTERDLLAKDIAKLTEEHVQVLRALSAVSAAIASLEDGQPTEAAVNDAAVSAVVDQFAHVPGTV